MSDDIGHIDGPETYERLPWPDRPRFDAAWQAALTRAARDHDLEPLVLLVCRWWEASGGDPAAAEATRGWLADFARTGKVRGCAGPVVCACRGPEIWAALPAAERVRFTAAWDREIAEAAVSRSWSTLWSITFGAYIETQTTDEERARVAADLAHIQRLLDAGRLDELEIWPAPGDATGDPGKLGPDAAEWRAAAVT